MKKEMRMISKDGTISKFPRYTSSNEEEEEEDKEGDKEEEEEEDEEEEEEEETEYELDHCTGELSESYTVSERTVSASCRFVQMANLSEDIQCAGSDARPPMLDRTDFASWQQRIRLYCRGKENGVNILKSIDEGPFRMGTFRETLTEGTKDKERYNADIRATNILLQGLPKDIYSLINHYTDAKDILDNRNQSREYYVRFAKLINDMRNIKMTMSKMQLNSKFVNNMLPEWGRFVIAVKLNRGLRDSNYDQLYAYLKQHEAHANENKMILDQFTQHTVDPLALMSNGRQNRGQGNNARGGGAAGYGGAQNRVGNANPGQARQIKCYNCNGIGHIARNCTQPKHPQNSEYFKDKMLLMQAQENRVALDEEQLLFIAGGQDNAIDEDVDEQPVQDLALNVDNVFQADDCDAFDSDVDEAPTAQTMFMANLSSADPVYDEAGLSYDSDILSEVHDHDHYQDAVCEHHEEHEMHDDYVKDNAVSVVQSNVSSVPNDAYMMIFNDMHEPPAQPVSVTTQNTVVDNLLTAEPATYKEQVEQYERHIWFELTEREQKIDEQLRIVITDQVIPFFKTLKEHFEGIQKALNKEIKEIKDVFEELEAEVDQNFVDRKHDEIERKNLLIAHDNLIADCLSKEVFYVATNFELNVSRFTEMHDAHTIIEARCLKREAELSNLRDKIQNDNHNELVKRFSNLEVNHLNLQLKYQNLKESFGNNPSTPASDTPDFDSAFTRSKADRTLDFRALDFQITQLTEKVTILQEQNELFRAENAKIKQHYKELYDSIKITRAKHIEQKTALTTENENLKV
ncbi:integrase, catalytic region, zinc finger, CCHC-type containing protein [Tanacetum coccineum]